MELCGVIIVWQGRVGDYEFMRRDERGQLGN